MISRLRGRAWTSGWCQRVPTVVGPPLLQRLVPEAAAEPILHSIHVQQKDTFTLMPTCWGAAPPAACSAWHPALGWRFLGSPLLRLHCHWRRRRPRGPLLRCCLPLRSHWLRALMVQRPSQAPHLPWVHCQLERPPARAQTHQRLRYIYSTGGGCCTGVSTVSSTVCLA